MKMIIANIGTLGCGKSINCAYLTRNAYLDDNAQVYSNIWLNCDYEPIDNIVSILDIRNAWIWIDDIIGWIDSRSFTKNAWITSLLMAMRKLKNNLIYSMQLGTGTDLRIREITDVNQYPWEIDASQLLFGMEFYNSANIEFMEPIEIQYSQSVADFYDTDEVAYQHIDLDELLALTRQLDKKQFASLCVYRYNWSKSLGYDLYDFTFQDKMVYAEEILLRQGYVLEK